MVYLIYETINILNGKRYIGKHATNNINDNYLGSGLYLNNAINKYGRENFSKKILFQFETEDEMNAKEIELITLDVVSDDMYYNIALGGQGGVIVLKEGHPLYEKTCLNISKAKLAISDKVSSIVKELHKTKRVGMYGKKQSINQKEIVSAVQKGRIKTQEEKDKHNIAYRLTIDNPNYVHPNKNKQKPRILCNHCNREIDKGNYVKSHGDKYKMKIKYEDIIENK